MKKLISFVMATVLCVGMTTTVLAANSVTTDTVDNPGTIEAVGVTYVEVDGQQVDMSDIQVVIDNAEIPAGVTTDAKTILNSVAPSLGAKSATTLACLDVSVKQISTGEEVDAAIVDLYCDVTGEEQDIMVLHYCTEHATWELMTEGGVMDGFIRVTFDHGFSPVMVVKYSTTAPAPAPQPETPSYDYYYEEEEVSPKTADVAMFGLYAAVALTGTVVAARKAKASK